MNLPDDCATMEDIRAEIDRLDAALMAGLAERARYVDRAAQIKKAAGLPARIAGRVDAVIDNIGRLAAQHGLPKGPFEQMWRDLIDWSIAREDQLLNREET